MKSTVVDESLSSFKPMYCSREYQTSTRVKNLLGNSISLQQNQFLMGTQAFASPPDMASSGVWENIILTKTSTSEGVCRMLYFIIFEFLPPFFDDKW